MGLKKSAFAGHAWSAALRMALVWVRKGGALKLAKHKWLHSNRKLGHSGRSRYGERQLSFDETPAFHFRTHRRPAAAASTRLLSCVNPLVEADGENEEDREFFKWSKEDYSTASNCEKVDNVGEAQVSDIDSGHEFVCEDDEEQEIDSKAEEFITKFYAQMKLQRQISFLQYNEMMERSCR